MSSEGPISFDPAFKVRPKSKLSNVEQKQLAADRDLKAEFNKIKANTRTIQDKNELYDFLQKNNSKNLESIDRILRSEKKSKKIYETSLHESVLNTVYTIDKIGKQLFNNEKISLNYKDKTYIGMALVVAIMFLGVLNI